MYPHEDLTTVYCLIGLTAGLLTILLGIGIKALIDKIRCKITGSRW